MKYISNSDSETIEIGEKLSSNIKDNVVVFLHGHLGAGKTTMVKGIVNGLGGDNSDISSPTYVYVNEYDIGVSSLRHMDLYRLERSGFDDELYGLLSEDDKPTVIEWPDRIGEDVMDYITENKKVIDIKIEIDNSRRNIKVSL